MAIYQRDRDFHKLFSEINVDIIPLRFIQDITCYLNNGKKIVLDATDLQDPKIKSEHLEGLIKDLEFYELISDLSVRIDYGLVEADVEMEVNKLLNRE